MPGLLARTIESVESRLVLLAPAEGAQARFGKTSPDVTSRDRLLREMQRLRGAMYVADGAIGPEALTRDGRHCTPEDDVSWHLLMTNAAREITACVWYREHEPDASIDQLRVRDCPLRRHSWWQDRVTRAVELDLARARRESLRYVEVGGWAVSKRTRGSGDGLILALGAYSLGRLLGGAIGLTTATVRHCSSHILWRLGGTPLEFDGAVVPPYYDPRYTCRMELLRFDSRYPRARYAGLVERLQAKLKQVAVFVDPAAAASEAAA